MLSTIFPQNFVDTFIVETNITETLSQVVSLSLLAMLPSPIFYGVIIDNTCLLWQEVTILTIVSKITYT